MLLCPNCLSVSVPITSNNASRDKGQNTFPLYSLDPLKILSDFVFLNTSTKSFQNGLIFFTGFLRLFEVVDVVVGVMISEGLTVVIVVLEGVVEGVVVVVVEMWRRPEVAEDSQ